MFKYYNANPFGRRINDCTVRAISLATNKTWNETYDELSDFARMQGSMFDDVAYIDKYLEERFDKIYTIDKRNKITVKEFAHCHPFGTYLITMNGHITCCIDGTIYDTFYPGDRLVWDAYEIKKKRY